MQYSLGIDAGGTYTDAVIVRDSDRKIVDSNKALTTYPQTITGIENAIDGLDPVYLKDVKLVSVSTTLATNTVLEGTGAPVALILVGEHGVERELPTKHVLFAEGGHDHNGEETVPLNIEAIQEFAQRVKGDVAAFAVSSHFSIRNPEHELRVKESLEHLTGLPVVCGHELSQDIGAYERAVTAFLNAQLIPIANHFIESIIEDIKKRGVEARMLMLKCDGSVVGIKAALEKPIESIFSGPAASLVGASYLSGLDTCFVIDVGGTSTDVSYISEGIPELTNSGAIVGGWQTRVRAIRMETSAMGGDSHVWTRDEKVFVGPRRVVPLCLASVKYPGFLEKLKYNIIRSRKLMDENVQSTKFFVRTGYEPIDLNKYEEQVLSVIDDEPLSFNDICTRLNRTPYPLVLDTLIRKRLVQAIGFTPTDALHVLGEYTQWDVEAAIAGAEKLARLSHMGKSEFCDLVKEKVANNMAFDLMSFILPGIPEEGVQKIVSGKFATKFKVDIPVVLLGGPVKAYASELGKFIDAKVVVPEFADVGNAAGALFGKGINRMEILIKPASLISPDEDFLVFSPLGRESFETHAQALEYARNTGRELVLEHMLECGLRADHVEINIKEKSVVPEGWTHAPMETKLIITGVGSPRLDA
ncbi:hydantoinase/oxoprolinase family protein [Methanolobus sp. ZRKC3]|uniref:hydantoinase/oxoprolinase N-terminal domain-containing protein n=1 Tax=Methanolobus sp. ZRKC3 TaxID=3125786 RepID=UPI0032511832